MNEGGPMTPEEIIAAYDAWIEELQQDYNGLRNSELGDLALVMIAYRAQAQTMAAALDYAIAVMEDVVRFRHLSDFTGVERWSTLDAAIAQARAARAATEERDA